MSDHTDKIGEFHYEGHTGTICYSEPDNMFYGVIQDIDDLVMYEGDTDDKLYEQFKHAVLDHINDLPRGDSEVITNFLKEVDDMHDTSAQELVV